MKKLITILIAGLFTLASYGQSGVLRGPGGLWIGNATTLTPVFKIGVTPITTTAAQFNYLNTATSNLQTQLNLKADTTGKVLGVAVADSANANGVSHPIGSYATAQDLFDHSGDDLLKAVQFLGSDAKGLPVGANEGKTNFTMSDSVEYMVLFHVPASVTITGVKVIVITQGAYKVRQYASKGYANTYNGVALSTISGTTYTQVALSTNDSTTWSRASSFSVVTIPFSTPYAAAAGYYYVSFIWYARFVTTAPVILVGSTTGDMFSKFIAGNNLNKVVGSVSSQHSIVSRISSDVTATTNNIFAWLY